MKMSRTKDALQVGLFRRHTTHPAIPASSKSLQALSDARLHPRKTLHLTANNHHSLWALPLTAVRNPSSLGQPRVRVWFRPEIGQLSPPRFRQAPSGKIEWAESLYCTSISKHHRTSDSSARPARHCRLPNRRSDPTTSVTQRGRSSCPSLHSEENSS